MVGTTTENFNVNLHKTTCVKKWHIAKSALTKVVFLLSRKIQDFRPKGFAKKLNLKT